VLEVETPLLASFGVTDIFLKNFSTDYFAKPLYLQTSPEYHMKRLLSQGSGSIYQLGKAFRYEQAGSHHNPEFTMLEWYRVGFDLFQLMDDVGDFLVELLGCQRPKKFSYQNIFIEHLDFDPFAVDILKLKQAVFEAGITLASPLESIDDYLTLLLSHAIEPNLGKDKPIFIYDYPATQASLSKVIDGRAKRFEVYYKGVEIANGFDELLDANIQRARFLEDNRQRVTCGLKPVAVDEYLVAALKKGLPQVSGVALGVDRLIMLMLNKLKIDEVLSFPIDSA
jgi:elongation factor P--(R)-beta-lysine ligase